MRRDNQRVSPLVGFCVIANVLDFVMFDGYWKKQFAREEGVDE